MGVHPPLLYTIGYERATLQDVSERLRAQGVTLLVDVRDSPRSRKKGFSKPSFRSLAREYLVNC